MEIIDKMIVLFSKHREEFGLDEPDDLESQEEFERQFCKLICEFKGEHELIQDQCMRPEHDYCVVCNVRREELEDK